MKYRLTAVHADGTGTAYYYATSDDDVMAQAGWYLYEDTFDLVIVHQCDNFRHVGTVIKAQEQPS